MIDFFDHPHAWVSEVYTPLSFVVMIIVSSVCVHHALLMYLDPGGDVVYTPPMMKRGIRCTSYFGAH